MPTATIELVDVTPSEKLKLWQVLQEYLRELNALEGATAPPGMLIEYPPWEKYWDGSAGRMKFWIVIGQGKVGFILLRSMSAAEWPSVPPPTQITELCIFRPFRSREIGASVLKFLLVDSHQRGEILTWDCHKKNLRAEKMYDRVVAEYAATAGADWAFQKADHKSEAGPMYRYVCGAI